MLVFPSQKTEMVQCRCIRHTSYCSMAFSIGIYARDIN